MARAKPAGLPQASDGPAVCQHLHQGLREEDVYGFSEGGILRIPHRVHVSGVRVHATASVGVELHFTNTWLFIIKVIDEWEGLRSFTPARPPTNHVI